MNRIYHYLKENKSSSFPRWIISVDTETREEKDSFGYRQHRLYFGIAHYIDVEKAKLLDKIFFKEATSFWQWAIAKNYTGRRLIITGHNLAFDLLILDYMHQLSNLGYRVELPIFNGARFIGKAHKDKRTIEFLDTMNFVPTSLKILGLSLGLLKKEMPSKSATLEEWVAYCERDVEIVDRFWLTLCKFWGEHDCGNFGRTAASSAFNAFRHMNCSKILIHNNSRALDLERAAYHGGRVECFRIGKITGQTLYFLDINSLYPSVMRGSLFPNKISDFIEFPSIEVVKEKMQNYYCIAKAVIETDQPVYPYVLRNKLVFPVGRFEASLHHCELEYALERGHLIGIRALSCYEQSQLFRSYVDKFYGLRQKYRGINPAFELFCKLLLNSLYGKFGEHGHQRRIVSKSPLVDFGVEIIYDERAHRQQHILFFNGIGYHLTESGEGFNSFPAIAGATTAYGRMRLWDLMVRAGLKNVFYTDTDSLLVNQQGYDNLESEIHQTDLGKLKVVQQIEEIEIFGNKDYRIGGKRTLKGIPLNAIQVGENEFQFDKFLTFRENISRGQTCGVMVETRRKKLRRVYDKGVVGDDGFVSPLIINDF